MTVSREGRLWPPFLCSGWQVALIFRRFPLMSAAPEQGIRSITFFDPGSRPYSKQPRPVDATEAAWRSTMKIRNSLKSVRGRHRDNQLVRRKGRVYIINKTQKRFKARQG